MMYGVNVGSSWGKGMDGWMGGSAGKGREGGRERERKFTSGTDHRFPLKDPVLSGQLDQIDPSVYVIYCT